MQETEVAPFVAVTVTVSPAVPPLMEIAGVRSFVMSSDVADPESESVTRSGVVGADGAVESTLIGSGVLAAEVLPAGSVSVAVTSQSPSVRVARSQAVATPTT